MAEERRAGYKEFVAALEKFASALEKLEEVVQKMDRTIAVIEERQNVNRKDIEDHDEILHGNSTPGLIKETDRLNGRMKMVFGILGGVYAISVIVFSVWLNSTATHLAALAAKLSLLKP